MRQRKPSSFGSKAYPRRVGIGEDFANIGLGITFTAAERAYPARPVELLAALAILAVLVVLLIAVSRRYGRPRLFVRPIVALWIIAGLFAVLLAWLWSD